MSTRQSDTVKRNRSSTNDFAYSYPFLGSVVSLFVCRPLHSRTLLKPFDRLPCHLAGTGILASSNYRVGQKVSYCTFSRFSLNVDQFSQFLPVDYERNLLLSGMHTTLIMSQHYLAKYKYPKTYHIYKW